jgi:hypothetical protein
MGLSIWNPPRGAGSATDTRSSVHTHHARSAVTTPCRGSALIATLRWERKILWRVAARKGEGHPSPPRDRQSRNEIPDGPANGRKRLVWEGSGSRRSGTRPNAHTISGKPWLRLGCARATFCRDLQPRTRYPSQVSEMEWDVLKLDTGRDRAGFYASRSARTSRSRPRRCSTEATGGPLSTMRKR